MNAEQIIKALKCCADDNTCYKGDCPYKSDEVSACTTKMSRDALALINELTEKIETLELTLEVARCNLDKTREWLNDAERKVEELTEENERLRCVGIPDYEVYIRLSDAKHAIMDYIGEQTVSKYVSEAECKAARGGAEGAMNELDYLTPAKVAPIADTVRKMHFEIQQRCIKGGIYPAFVASTIDQIAKEMLEGNNESKG